MNTNSLVLTALLGLLFPAGVVLWGEGSHRRCAAAFALTAAAIGVAGFFAFGFALAFGAAGGRYPALGELDALKGAWTPLQPWLGPGWVMAGASGFFLAMGDEGGAYALFLFQSVLLVSALSVMVVTWAGRARPTVMAMATALAGWLLYPLAASWVWGAGWLYALGSLRGLGHGFVDAGGAALLAVTAGAGALAGILVWPRRQADAETGATPTSAEAAPTGAGAFLMVIGLLSLQAGSAVANGLSPALPLTNGVVSAAAGCCLALAYMGFTTGKLNGPMAARGLVAGLVATLAGAPFMAPPAAALIGAVAGLLTCFAAYLVEAALHRDDPASAVSSFLVPGLWGILAVGFFADGRTGAGWHGVGPLQYLGAAGQGVTGLLPAAGLAADPGQMSAQLVGAAVALAWAFLPVWGLLRLARGTDAPREMVAPPDPADPS
jgi:Amt family ammonium transporter